MEANGPDVVSSYPMLHSPRHSNYLYTRKSATAVLLDFDMFQFSTDRPIMIYAPVAEIDRIGLQLEG
jgi:hypothetical protein